MTSKRKPIRREVRCLYKAILKSDGKVLNLKKMVGFYDEYNDWRGRILTSREAPGKLKMDLQPLKTPLYMKWIKQYFTRQDMAGRHTEKKQHIGRRIK